MYSVRKSLIIGGDMEVHQLSTNFVPNTFSGLFSIPLPDTEKIQIEDAMYGRLESDDGTQSTCTAPFSHNNVINCLATERSVVRAI